MWRSVPSGPCRGVRGDGCAATRPCGGAPLRADARAEAEHALRLLHRGERHRHVARLIGLAVERRRPAGGRSREPRRARRASPGALRRDSRSRRTGRGRGRPRRRRGCRRCTCSRAASRRRRRRGCGSPASRQRRKRAIAISGRWRGPYTVKKRRHTAGRPWRWCAVKTWSSPGALGGRVGRDRPLDGVLLGEGELGVDAVDRGGGGEDEPRPAVRDGRLQQVERPDAVDLLVEDRLGQRRPHAGPGREVHDGVEALLREEPEDERPVADVALDQPVVRVADGRGRRCARLTAGS